jgi:hypothetical protein
MTLKRELSEVYLDWVNNFVSVGGFADYYGLTEDQARTLIDLSRSIYEGSITD